MKHKQLNSRMDKINFLQNIKDCKATIQELMPFRVEIWKQYMDEANIFINESTCEEITAAQLEAKLSTKGNNIIFVTVLHRSRHEQ